MKPGTFLIFVLPLCLIANSNVFGAGERTNSTVNPLPGPDGWFQLPSREVVLDLRHKSLEFGARQDSGQFVTAILNTVLQGGYTVHLSDDFIQAEINYYRENIDREAPIEMSKVILGCLEGFRASGVLEWDCFKVALNRTSAERQRHLPWLAPPFQAKSIRLADSLSTNLPCLSLSLEWVSLPVHGGVLYSGPFASAPGQSVLLEGKGKMWAFSAVMRLTKGSETLFEKTYQREEWKRSYSSVFEQPLWKTSEAILQDIKIGLRPKPAPPADQNSKKSRKGNQPKSDKNVLSDSGLRGSGTQ